MTDEVRPPEPDATQAETRWSGTQSGSTAPPTEWDRYEIEAFLGAGGMGSVYRARDRQLGRLAAIKFLHATDSASVARFQREAQAQARVDHPNLCKVFETGLVEGKPFIAMQYVDGRPLSETARELTLREKVSIICDVAEGLHEAHTAGLLHRDIKPGNVLVERSARGWHAYLTDFGLARDDSGPSMTMTGDILGTPQYMSPEQARGSHRDLDARSDVYSLGATLYSLLSGRPPFRGESTLDILDRVRNEVPTALRSEGYSVPDDVESITFRCLRKDPAERYATAKDLADDLRRYLAGEPVVARPTSRLYRWRVRLQRHRAATVAGVLGLTLALGALGWGLSNRWAASRQAAVAQAFGQRVERIDNTARLAAMAPLHDLREDRERIRDQMRSIQEEMDELGGIATGPGEYALGRGHLALGDFHAANEHLQRAWDEGHRSPEVAYARGLVLGEFYRRGLDEVALLASETERRDARADLERRFRDPALEMLRASSAEGGLENPRYVEALLALYEGRADEAIELAAASQEGRPWFHESFELKGRAHRVLGEEDAERGEYEAAEIHFDAADSAYARGSVIAPSALSVRDQHARLLHARMSTQINGPGGDVAPEYERGREILAAAAVADPESAELALLSAMLECRMAQYVGGQGEEAMRYLETAAVSAARATQDGTVAPAAFRQLGMTHRLQAEELRERGEDPSAQYAAAESAYVAAGRLDPGGSHALGLGLLYKSLARYQSSIGEDALPTLQKSAQAYESALVANPEQVAANHNLGVTYYTMARQRMASGEDPRELLSRSGESLERALAINRDQLATLYTLGRVRRALGLFLEERGENPLSDYELAAAAFREAIENNPESVYQPQLNDGLGKTLRAMGSSASLTGRDPREHFAAADSAFAAAIEARASYVHAHVNRGFLHGAAAAHEALVGRDPRAHVERAVAASEAALELNPRNLAALANGVTAWLELAGHRVATGRDGADALAQARNWLDRAEAVRPDASFLRTSRGRLARVVGRAEAAAGRDPAARFAEAEAHYRRLLDEEPSALAWAELSTLMLHRLEAIDAGDAAWLDVGIAAADSALNRNPTYWEALAVRGALRARAAASESASARRDTLVARARSDLERALEQNRWLEVQHGPRLEALAAFVPNGD